MKKKLLIAWERLSENYKILCIYFEPSPGVFELV